MIKVFVKVVCCFTLLAVPAASSAQFGGLGAISKKVVGGGSAMTGDEADQFLNGAFRSTKNVMMSAALIADAVDSQRDATGRKAYRDGLTNAQNPGELNVQVSNFQSDLNVLALIQSDRSKFDIMYQKSSAGMKKQLGIALVNLAIGIARNVDLAGKSAGVVKAVGRNPQLVSRAGQFKAAASLVGVQAKGLSGFATTLPQLMAAAKVRAPANATMSEPASIIL